MLAFGAVHCWTQALLGGLLSTYACMADLPAVSPTLSMVVKRMLLNRHVGAVCS